MLSHLTREQCRRSESVKAEPATGSDSGNFQRPVADDAAAQQRRCLEIGEGLGNQQREVGAGGQSVGEAPVAIPPGEHRLLAEILRA